MSEPKNKELVAAGHQFAWLMSNYIISFGFESRVVSFAL